MLTRRSMLLGLGAASLTPPFDARYAFGQAARPRLPHPPVFLKPRAGAYYDYSWPRNKDDLAEWPEEDAPLEKATADPPPDALGF